MLCYDDRLKIAVLTQFFISLFVYMRTICVNVVPYKYLFYEVKAAYPTNAMYLNLCESFRRIYLVLLYIQSSIMLWENICSKEVVAFADYVKLRWSMYILSKK